MLIPLGGGGKGLKVREGGAVNKYCHESHIFRMFESHQLDVLGIWRLYSTASSPLNTSAYAIWSLSLPSSCEMLGATMQECKY